MSRELAFGSKVGISAGWPEGGYSLKEHKSPLDGLACRHN